MTRRSWLAIATASLSILLGSSILSGETAASGTESPGQGSPSLSIQALGKRKGENPIRRFEIVTLGSFPIMLFYTDFSFDLARFLATGFSEGFDPEYAPWPFKTTQSFTPDDSERLIRLGTALGASIGVGIADAIIRARRAAKRAAAAEEAVLDATENAEAAGRAANPSAGSSTPPSTALPAGALPAGAPSSTDGQAPGDGTARQGNGGP